jgi:hypothetical protein
MPFRPRYDVVTHFISLFAAYEHVVEKLFVVCVRLMEIYWRCLLKSYLPRIKGPHVPPLPPMPPVLLPQMSLGNQPTPSASPSPTALAPADEEGAGAAASGAAPGRTPAGSLAAAPDSKATPSISAPVSPPASAADLRVRRGMVAPPLLNEGLRSPPAAVPALQLGLGRGASGKTGLPVLPSQRPSDRLAPGRGPTATGATGLGAGSPSTARLVATDEYQRQVRWRVEPTGAPSTTGLQDEDVGALLDFPQILHAVRRRLDTVLAAKWVPTATMADVEAALLKHAGRLRFKRTALRAPLQT